MPFEVRGLELHYRPPFNLLVDKLEQQDGVYFGRATFRGYEFGQFRMRRLDNVSQLKEQLIKRIDEEYAMEQNVLLMIDGMSTTPDYPDIQAVFEPKAQVSKHDSCSRK